MKKMINELIRAWYGLRALLLLARLVALFPLLLLVDAGELLEWDPAQPETPRPALWRIYQWTPTGGLEWAAVRYHVAPWPLLPTATVHPPDDGASYIAQAEDAAPGNARAAGSSHGPGGGRGDDEHHVPQPGRRYGPGDDDGG